MHVSSVLLLLDEASEDFEPDAEIVEKLTGIRCFILSWGEHIQNELYQRLTREGERVLLLDIGSVI
jgi:hypothetical protein